MLFRSLRSAALLLRDMLRELGLASWVKTSGSKGYHIVVPLDGEAGADDVFHFAHGVGAVLVARDAAHLTQEFSKADREGRIFVDTGRNQMGATFAAVYAVRPKLGAPVSALCTWDELGRGAAAPQAFALRTMAARLDAVGDLWADLHRQGQSLRAPAERLRALLPDEDRAAARAASTRRPGPRGARRGGGRQGGPKQS